MSQVNTEELIPFLRRNSVFSLLDEPDIERLAEKMTLLRFAVGDVIIQEGDVGNHAFLIYSGRVRVVKQSTSGKVVTLITQHAGDIFGEQAILKDITRTASVRAAEDVALFRIEQEDFRNLVDAVPKLATYIEKFMNDSALRDFLRTSTFLESLKPSEITSLLDQLTEQEFAANTTVLSEGDAGDFMYIVRSGQLKVERRGNGSPEFVRYLREGEYFGEWALMTGEARSATVTTLSDTRCFTLSRDHFDALLESAPQLRDQLVERFRRYQLDEKLEPEPGTFSGEVEALEAEKFDGTASDDSTPEPDEGLGRVKQDGSTEHPASNIVQDVDSTTPPVSNRGARNGKTIPDGQIESINAVIPDEWKHSATLPSGWKKKRPEGLWQHTESDCGPTALAMVALFYVKRISISRLTAIANVGRSGTTLYQLEKTAQAVGFETHAIRTSALDQVALPAIAHCGGQHYVTVFQVNDSKVLVGDPTLGLQKVDRVQFNSEWSGHLLLLRPTNVLREIEKQETIRDTLNRPLFKSRHLSWLIANCVLMYLAVLVGPWTIGAVIDGGPNWVHYAGLALFMMWPVLNILRWRAVADMLDDSSIFSEQLIRNNLSQSPTPSDGNTRLMRLLRVRNVVAMFFDGRPVASLLNSPSTNLLLVLAFVTDFRLGSIAFIGSYVAAYFERRAAARNARRLVASVNESIRADVQLLDQSSNLELVQSSAPTQALNTSNPSTASHRVSLTPDHSPFNGYNLVGLCILLVTGLAIFLWGNVLVHESEISLGDWIAVLLYFSIGSLTLLREVEAKEFLPVLRWHLDQLWDVDVIPNTVSEREIQDHLSESSDTNQSLAAPSIVLENVDFSYASDLPNAVSGISLKIEPGQKVAVVGRSGSGKSSLLRLIRTAVLPNSGRVLIDGVDSREIDHRQLQPTFGVALQDSSLLSGTIRENIALFDSAANLDQIKDAALLSNAHEFIESLPLGYETEVGANGNPLSTSRTQRICLARSILHNPQVLVWDEATANLDLDTERRLNNKLSPWLRDRTVVHATRRLHSIQNADLILVMSEGTIVEQGTHPELIESRGLYYYLCCQHAIV
jgi:ABC-type bacteriocin/lantibiotic exporter with double-glycine peptidase domain/CRP-like cAMP-binding protein